MYRQAMACQTPGTAAKKLSSRLMVETTTKADEKETIKT